MEQPSRRRRALAIATAVALPCASAALLWLLVERPFLRAVVPPGREDRAALAIRDDVPAFQKWGTATFTHRYLQRYYGRSCYLTQAPGTDRKREFQAFLAGALASHRHADLFLLAHTNRYVSWVAELDPELTVNLRLVYNTGCRDASQAQRWLRLGADAFIGHPGESQSPPFYFYFLRRWTVGRSAEGAAGEANVLARRAFDLAERLSFGRLDADELWEESRALSFGDTSVTIEGEER